jgi:hypothetical protein
MVEKDWKKYHEYRFVAHGQAQLAKCLVRIYSLLTETAVVNVIASRFSLATPARAGVAKQSPIKRRKALRCGIFSLKMEIAHLPRTAGAGSSGKAPSSQ